MADKLPSGVHQYGHKPGMRKGKYHPDVGHGPSLVQKEGGTVTAVPKAPRASNKYVAGVHRGDGTEPRTKKNAPKHLQKTVGSAHRAPRTDSRPSGIKVADGSGTKVPHKIK